MARLFDDASSQYLSTATAVVSGPPFSAAVWIYVDDLAINGEIVNLANMANNADSYRLVFAGPTSGHPLLSIEASTSASGVATSTTGVGATNVWHHAAGVWASHSSRSVYLDGGSKATETTTCAAGTVNVTSLGRLSRLSVPATYFSGRLAHAALWNVALTDDEVLALASKVSPLRIRPAALVGFWPLYGGASPEPDLSTGQHAMTVTGATQAAHAPVAPLLGGRLGWRGNATAPVVTGNPWLYYAQQRRQAA